MRGEVRHHGHLGGLRIDRRGPRAKLEAVHLGAEVSVRAAVVAGWSNGTVMDLSAVSPSAQLRVPMVAPPGCGCREVGAGSEALMAALLMLGFASRGARRRRVADP